MSETPDRDPPRDDTQPPTIDPRAQATPSHPLDRLAAFLIGWPSTLFLSLWCLRLLYLWVPDFLNWPLFTDSDHFAMIAQAWSRGKLPYREVFTNQLPGEIYLHRAIGEWAGWGNSVAYYAVDLAMVLLFGLLSILWSFRRFGRILPGLIGFLVFLNYYSSQNYFVAGERDWHAAFLAAVGFFALDLIPGRAGRIVSGLAVGLAMSNRPQFGLVGPGMFLLMVAVSRGDGDRRKEILLAWAEWSAAAGLAFVLAFLPLIVNGPAARLHPLLSLDLLRGRVLAIDQAAGRAIRRESDDR